jgi:pilus assembly protein CpaE
MQAVFRTRLSREAQPMIAAIISKDPVLRTRLENALEAAAGVESVLLVPEFPSSSEICALEDTHKKYVVFIDFHNNSERAIAIAGEINRSCPSVGVIALNVSLSQNDLIAVVRAGIGEVLPQSFSNRDVETAVFNVTRKLYGVSGAAAGDGIVYAFLPAKPGSGASSLAAYSALACAKLPGRRPLLLDFDLRLGITSFVLKLNSNNSIINALENANRMDQTLWDQLVSQRGNLDILGSAPAEFGVSVPLESFLAILKWSRRQYSALIVDLPGNMEDFEIATLQQAGTIFVVCGSDLVSIHMAGHTIQRLRSLNLIDRVSVLLNRVEKRTVLPVRDIERILGLPICVSIPAGEEGIRAAVQEGAGVDPKTFLGKQIEVIAQKMIGNVQSAANLEPPQTRKRFVEFFSIPPAKGLDPRRP